MQPSTLTPKGITTITEGNNVPVIVQVLNLQPDIKQINKQKAYVSQISDGYAKLKCYWNSTVFTKITNIKDKFNGAVVSLTDYSSSAKKILVYNFNIIYLLDQIIGNPTSYQNYLANNLNQGSSNQIDLSKVVTYKQPQKQIKSTPKKESYKPKSNTGSDSVTVKVIGTNSTSHYETIEELYTGMDNWTLFCRINKVRYREFSNKKGSRTKLLQFQIRDRKNWTINCTIFGEHAQKMSNNIREGQVYQFSRGNIKVDTYKTPSHEKQSPFTITFTQHSSIKLGIDDDSIKLKQSAFNPISKIKQWKINGQIDVACIIKQIKPESVYLNKTDNQTHQKRVIIVCDPIDKIQTEVTFWRASTEIVNQSLLHKTVALESFKVHQYNGRLSLTATIRSKIYQLNGHKLNKYQNNDSLGQFESISYKKDENREDKQNISTIKKLLQQCQKLQGKQVAWSTFIIYINGSRQQGKKMYIGCPLSNCKKVVDELDFKCPHCNKSFQKPVFRYVVGINISDSLGTGSIWTTAYDDFCKTILSYDQDLSAQKARKLSDESFNEIMKRCYFQQFKITICSQIQQTPDSNRRIRHKIVSYSIVNYAKQANSNLQKIKAIIEKKQL